ncbi:NtaA/DmoA family FMN-dependent monooxygenase [Thauera sinica]|uniref:NtaA/DmoA family FMN-dependent monooxygenase n=1 Tax=Thauera sinica TaxID=2665146 RepID=A0ABW1AMB6_9RHOO|nr:NtaA/DmoA family FMN-dependent monooxygenase [Thauera sp. K11]ATE60704.1 monooxygenase [Thauera sp. K11]
MSQAHRQIKLGLLFNSPGSDRPESAAAADGRPAHSLLGYYADIARRLEQARFDFLMVADTVSTESAHQQAPRPEPVTLFSALAGITRHIGLVPTVSTTFTEPFNLARQLQSLDQLSDGRAAWNVVTSSNGERNFGDAPIPDHGERYRRAAEHVEVVRKLWDSWEDDAIVNDHGRHIAVRADKVHRIDHRGRYYAVEGPLNVARSRQGHPVLFQAGSSEDGKAFAAPFAEGIYTAQQTLAGAQAFYADLKGRVRAHGRDPEHIKILPGLCTVIADTEESARRLDDEQWNDIPPHVLRALEQQLGGIDLSDLDPDQPVPAERLPALFAVQGRQSRYGIFRDFALSERWSVRRLLRLQASSAGHGRIVGTPEQIADHLQEWFLNGAADGYILMPSQGPGGIEIFAGEVVPILQRRGLFRRDYEADTLRGNLGLPVPGSRFGQPPAHAARAG